MHNHTYLNIHTKTRGGFFFDENVEYTTRVHKFLYQYLEMLLASLYTVHFYISTLVTLKSSEIDDCKFQKIAMKPSLIILTTLVSCISATTFKCFVVELPGLLDCKILNKDMTISEINDSFEFDGDDEEFEDFTRLSIVETKLNGFPDSILKTFSKIKELVLSENELKQWRPEYLHGGDHVTILYIGYNPIEHLEANSFALAPNLEKIDFIHSHLADIDSNAFAGLPKLSTLRLHDNKIGRSLKSDTFSELAESLTTLNLGGNSIKEIPDGMLKNLKKLESLSLYLNNLKEVDGGVFPESLKKMIGLIQFKIINPPENLEYKIEEIETGSGPETSLKDEF